MRATAAASILAFTSSLVAMGCTREAAITDAPIRPSFSIQGSTAVVPAFVCAVILGGDWTVPAGAEVVVDQRWEARNRGLVQSFLNAQATTLSLNGGPAVDVSGSWGPIAPVPADGVYRAELALSTGTSLSAGQSMTFDLVLPLSHRVHDGFTLEDGTSHKPLFFGPGVAFDFPCRVTAQ
jgi:hypothetical protein